MRYQPRHRAAIRRSQSAIGLTAAGLIAGAAVMLMSASANADSTATGTLNFAGNCGVARLALAKSVPSQTSVAVTTSSTVTVANDLPCGAHIYVNGKEGAAVGEGSKYTFKAASGSTTLQMVPDGLELLSSFEPATVTGHKAAASPSPTNGGSTGSSGSGSSGSGSSGSSGTGSQGSSSSGSSGAQHSTGSGTAAGGSAPTNGPAAGSSPSIKVHQPVARGAVPSKAAAPGTGSGTSGGGGETNGTTGTGAKDAGAAPQAVSDTSPSGATSVLALIAAVCLFGVGAVAIRTVLTQRRHIRAQQI